ncbi:hypothetical protein Tco_0823157 [Tanacetum coccineum]|uniref:Uncharacterized protein n=1 Tax=Tanacetum coccineum TaxID=301880 RepID=A0ABQ5AI29_9ASTR
MDQSASLRMFGSDTIKLDRMDGMNFTHWKEKMKFLLTAFKVYYVLEGPPVGVITDKELRKREQDETLCRGYILKKYTAEKEGADKFITFKFFEFAMEDNLSILDQIQKHLRIEEETRIREKNLNGASCSKVNYVDSEKKNKGNDKSGKGISNATARILRRKIRIQTRRMNLELHMASVTTNDDWWYDSDAIHCYMGKSQFTIWKECYHLNVSFMVPALGSALPIKEGYCNETFA